jgi:magnesium-transporting ATPase (P-type)
VNHYWSIPASEVIDGLGTRREGLTGAEAAERLRLHGRNTLAVGHGPAKALWLFLDRFRSPLVLILIFAAIVAFVVHDWLPHRPGDRSSRQCSALSRNIAPTMRLPGFSSR